ncbi:Probable transposable element [Penicillium roqueforti FM164]|uniref:Probable transposable element n=1 Tax=Penicillium roqueforti (strain FM164) TaxID=1365484 RepID=W6Q4D8_PENRF|nr:Probable transposable element [Penicillium roqueforti FM164]
MRIASAGLAHTGASQRRSADVFDAVSSIINATRSPQFTASLASQRNTKSQKAKELREKVDSFTERWTAFQDRYADPIFQSILGYIQYEWLYECPEKFLHIHTSQYLHLNKIATSRNESTHWLLKQDLIVSTNDLPMRGRSSNQEDLY